MDRPIPSTGERLTVIGLGTWQRFDTDENGYEPLKKVLRSFRDKGGKLIDSSPMYGRSEAVIGSLTKDTKGANKFFYATKVWTEGKQQGIQQMEDSFRKMNCTVMDLMQVHNLVDWETHLVTLRKWKEEGRIRYLGITHYTDAMHEALEKIITAVPIDFVQFNYSITNRNAEKRLLPAAAAKGVATVINRPFGEGALFRKVEGKSLPAWASDYGINSWSQFFLKFLISHPAVTCVIPATASPQHMEDNMAAGEGALPDEAIRKKMAEYIL